MSYLISGVQQVGIGVRDVDRAWAWYRRHFGLDVPVFREAAEAPLMTRYTGDAVQARDACLALNMQGGGGMEIWQYTSRTPVPPDFDPALGDTGILATRIGAVDVGEAYDKLSTVAVGEVTRDPAGSPHFLVRDPSGLLFDVVPRGAWFADGAHATSGPTGVLIGVSDIDGALPLYRDLLGYDRIVYDETAVFGDWTALPGGQRRLRRMLLEHTAPRKGAFAPLFGPSALELVQAVEDAPRKIFAGRFWGDLGFIHLCFDIRGMDDLRTACELSGFPFTVDSGDSFDMGEAAGRFAYIEDPDGTLIEFVETHKVPILKKFGIYLNLRNRPPEKALPRWMIRALGLGRVTD